jgi:hypothetical protein
MRARKWNCGFTAEGVELEITTIPLFCDISLSIKGNSENQNSFNSN